MTDIHDYSIFAEFYRVVDVKSPINSEVCLPEQQKVNPPFLRQYFMICFFLWTKYSPIFHVLRALRHEEKYLNDGVSTNSCRSWEGIGSHRFPFTLSNQTWLAGIFPIYFHDYLYLVRGFPSQSCLRTPESSWEHGPSKYPLKKTIFHYICFSILYSNEC